MLIFLIIVDLRGNLMGFFNIGYHGVISENRGLVNLIRSVKYLKHIDKMKIIIIGDGPFGGDLKEIADSEGISQNIIFTGAVDYKNVPELLANFDVGVLPFPDLLWWRISSPLKLYEYMSMGIPVIATDLPCHNVVKNKLYCKIIENNSPDKIANAVDEYYESSCSKSDIARSSRNDIKKNHMWSLRAMKYLNFIEKIQNSK